MITQLTPHTHTQQNLNSQRILLTQKRRDHETLAYQHLVHGCMFDQCIRVDLSKVKLKVLEEEVDEEGK